jgi:hypothetical protein
VEKDVTSYLNWFLTDQTAYLSIPNNVDSTYTGIPLVNISLTFYAADAENPPAEGLPTILPVSSAPANWSAIEVTAGSNLSYSVTLPYDDVVATTLELMAMPHGCEEFWYTNIDNDEAASKYGLCGGGVYRELQVYVDGILAGATYPMVVIYTGGINPFLWRPLTGIMSFDIPAYSFDLTPFVLGDGKAHEITVKVLGGDSQGGMWYLDAALKLYRDPTAAPVSGGVLQHHDSGSNVTVASGRGADGYGWNTTGTHQYRVIGQLIRAAGTAAQSTMTLETSGALGAWNTNVLSDNGAVETTNGQSTSVHSDALSAAQASVTDSAASDGRHRLVQSVAVYPYSMVSSYKQDATTMDMTATVNITYGRTNVYAPLDNAPERAPHSPDYKGYNTSWHNSIWSSAAYNRSLDHSTVYVESDTATAGYFVGSTNSVCYRRLASAEAGFVNTDEEAGQCDFPKGKYICGYELCQGGAGRRSDVASVVTTDGASLGATAKAAAIGTVAKGRTVDAAEGRPLVRHPLMGRAKLAVPTRRVLGVPSCV